MLFFVRPLSVVCRLSLLVCALVMLGSAHAAHITDKLVVGVYPQASAEGTPLHLISSGTPLEVLQSQNGFSEVRLANETQGWVESAYITDEKPAKAMLLETQAKLRQMGIELAALREKSGAGDAPAVSAGSAPPTAREAQLRQSLKLAEQHIAELEAELADVPNARVAKGQLDDLRSRTDQAIRMLADARGLQVGPVNGDTPMMQDAFTRYRMWIIGAVAFVLGIGIGVAFIDYRIRKRYGGFRI